MDEKKLYELCFGLSEQLMYSILPTIKQTTMKVKALTILTIAALFSLSFATTGENPIDRVGIKGPIQFNDTSFGLSWTAKPNDNNYIQEYLPNTEKLETFNQMLTVHLFITEAETKDIVQQKIKWLKDRKKIDPVCNYILNESPDGKEFMLDFLIGENKDNKMAIAEFNVYRYSQVDLENNRKAILIYFYSKRSYGSEITAFLNKLSQERTKYLNEMISTKMPPIKIVED